MESKRTFSKSLFKKKGIKLSQHNCYVLPPIKMCDVDILAGVPRVENVIVPAIS
jgi:hypothetical protein